MKYALNARMRGEKHWTTISGTARTKRKHLVEGFQDVLIVSAMSPKVQVEIGNFNPKRPTIQMSDLLKLMGNDPYKD